MKKILLTAMALLTIASASAFGMYGADNTWLFFLIHGNQLRARMNQLGFTLGNGTIKGTFGFKANTFINGSILNTDQKNSNPLEATVSGGIGYTANGFGIGLGYNYTYATYMANGRREGIDAHTPVITMNAVNNNLRIAVPVSVSVKDDLKDGRKNYLGIHIPAQIRFYTGIDAFNYIRFEFNYGNNSYEKDGEKLTAQYIGFQLRLHFLNTVVGNNVTLNPFIRVDFNGALDKNRISGFGTAEMGSQYKFSELKSWSAAEITKDALERNPYEVRVLPSLSLSVNTDYINVIFEPGIGYQAVEYGEKGRDIVHRLYWAAYGEVYIKPTPDLEWYFEMDVNNGVGKIQTETKGLPIAFGANTGLTWYIPALNGSQQ